MNFKMNSKHSKRIRPASRQNKSFLRLEFHARTHHSSLIKLIVLWSNSFYCICIFLPTNARNDIQICKSLNS
jgi:hypothetical protein